MEGYDRPTHYRFAIDLLELMLAIEIELMARDGGGQSGDCQRAGSARQ